MVSDAQIKDAYAKGRTVAVISKLLDVPSERIKNVLGINDDDTQRTVSDIPKSITREMLATLGHELLYSLGQGALHNPEAFKPAEILAISNQLLDRGIGKAAQTLNVNSSGMYEAAWQFIEDKTQRPVIDLLPEPDAASPAATSSAPPK